MHNIILIPIDMAHTEIGKKMLELANLNASKGARIILLNIVEAVPGWIAAELPSDIIPESRRAALEKLGDIAKSVDSDCKVEVEVRTGHASRTISEFAKDVNADLIIIGSHKPGISDYFLGSTASKIVRHASCSVYVER